MILENKSLDIFKSGIGETRKMTLNRDLESHYIKTVTEFQYKNPLASTIREVCSNSVDIHEEIGQELPVIVSLQKNESGKWEFSVQDFGSGLDEEQFYKYIMGVGESTKRENPKARGGFGAGCKCWVSYQTSCTYICRKDGIERKYLIFKGEEVPEAMLIHEMVTVEPNGVTFKMELTNDYQEYENCKRLIKNQLSYFPNIYFNVEGLDNTYKINQNSLFEWNTLNPEKELHISLKQVYYPISWASLGMSAINLPVAIRFEDYEEGIKPILSREEVNWLGNTKELVKNKIVEVIDWFTQKYNESVDNIDLADIPIKMFQLDPQGKKEVTIEEKTFDITRLDKHGSVPFNLPNIVGLNKLTSSDIYQLRYKFTDRFKVIGISDNYSLSMTKRVERTDLSTKMFGIIRYSNIILCDKKPTGIYRQYLGEKVKNSIFITDKGPRTSFNRHKQGYDELTWYREKLSLHKHPKTEWRDYIKEYLLVQKSFTDKFKLISDFPIDPVWNEERKRIQRENKDVTVKKQIKKIEVNLRLMDTAGNTKAGVITSISDLNTTDTILYGRASDKDSIGRVRSIIPIYILCERDIKRLEETNLSNWMTFDQYRIGSSQHYKDICIRLLAEDLRNNIDHNSSRFLIEVNLYYKKLYDKLHSFKSIGYMSSIIEDEMKEKAKENNYWGSKLQSIFDQIKLIEKEIDLSFLTYISLYKDEGMTVAKQVYQLRQKEVSENQQLHPRYI